MFGNPKDNGEIAHHQNVLYLRQILFGTAGGDMDEAFDYNFSARDFKRRRLHEVVASDPFINDSSTEWCRTLERKTVSEMILCCPEDVGPSKKSQRGATKVCRHCKIPFCTECFNHLRREEKHRKPWPMITPFHTSVDSSSGTRSHG